MLSAFAHQIQDLDKRVSAQQTEITEVRGHLATGGNTDQCHCQPTLANIQSQVDSNHFRLNDLAAKFSQLKTRGSPCVDHYGSPMCSDLSDSGPFYEDTNPCLNNAATVDTEAWRAPGSRGPTPNCLPEGYESPPPKLSSPVALPGTKSNLRYSAKEFFAAASFANVTGGTNASEPEQKISQAIAPAGSSLPKKCINPWLVDNAKIREPPPSQVNQTHHQPNRLAKSVLGAGQAISVENITNIAAENSSLKQQILTYRKKVCDLEEKLKSCETSMQDLRLTRDNRVHQDTDWGRRQEWYEHKLKLLKQDKRRRGETIGKLLKCIDDLKDCGRLDESRVKEGRAVLAATLVSNGLHTEERICKVVDAVEYDRVPRTPPAADPCDNGPAPPVANHHLDTQPTLTDYNQNNSAFFNGRGTGLERSEESLLPSQQYYLQSERLAEMHGFIPIESTSKHEDMEMM